MNRGELLVREIAKSGFSVSICFGKERSGNVFRMFDQEGNQWSLFGCSIEKLQEWWEEQLDDPETARLKLKHEIRLLERRAAQFGANPVTLPQELLGDAPTD